MRICFRWIITWAFSAVVLCANERPITNIVATSAANFDVGLPPRGSIGAIFCVGLESIEGTVAASSVPLPRELAGVRVTIGGASAPLFAVANLGGYYQINVQTPQEAKFDESVDPPRVEVKIEQFGAGSTVRLAEGINTVRLRPKPGEIFMATISGSVEAEIYGQPLVWRASDFSLITRDNPARPNDTLVLYATGLAPTDPPVPTGEASPGNPPASIPAAYSTTPPGVLMRGTTVGATIAVEPQFVGLAPGLVGVYQVNFKVVGPGAGYDGFMYLYLVRLECPGTIGLFFTCRNAPYWRSKAVHVPYKPD